MRRALDYGFWFPFFKKMADGPVEAKRGLLPDRSESPERIVVLDGVDEDRPNRPRFMIFCC
jgi:hypothetical protein